MSLAAFRANKHLVGLERWRAAYLDWVQQDNYLVFHDEDCKTFFAVKCAKRGNDVYCYRLWKKFRGLDKVIEGLEKEKLLFVTLTHDNEGEWAAAWGKVGVAWNRFMSCLRRAYGRVFAVRTFESTNKGFPHVHCLLYFPDHSFVFWRDSHGRLRTPEKPLIASFWRSFVDVQGFNDAKGAVRYLIKYLWKVVDWKFGHQLSLAIMWAERKRSYSVSRWFQKRLNDLIILMHNSTMGYSLPFVRTLNLIVFYPRPKWVCEGVVPAGIIGASGWWFSMDDLSKAAWLKWRESQPLYNTYTD